MNGRKGGTTVVISKTPFRMSFFGGGTDMPYYFKEHGGSVISTTFDKYCYVTVRHLPSFFDYSNEIFYSRLEKVNDVDNIRHPAVREAMRYLDMRELHVAYDADLPARSGLGTSSAFTVGMLNAFYALKGKYMDKERLAKDAIYVERTMCREAGGWQDQIASAYGGFNRIDFEDEGFTVHPITISKRRKNELEENIMMFFSGKTRLSSDIEAKKKKDFQSKITELSEMKQLVDEAEKILRSDCSMNEFGKLLDYTWKLKRGLSTISTAEIDRIYEKARSAGAEGGKLLGAGGGGFVILYVEKDKHKKVLEALEGILHVPIKFENMGTSILYFQGEEYKI